MASNAPSKQARVVNTDIRVCDSCLEGWFARHQPGNCPKCGGEMETCYLKPHKGKILYVSATDEEEE